MNCSFKWDCPAGSFPYTVRQGDTLYNIAKTFETSVSRLQELNSIGDINRINTGDVLCIPQPLQYFPACRTTNYYVVNKGDTISSISSYFGVSDAQIVYSNIGIDSENLYEGMVLCIPLAPPKVCIKIDGDMLALSYESGEEVSFPVKGGIRDFSSAIVGKQLDTSFGGKKRLNTLVPDIGISNISAKKSERDIILGDNDMDKVFNLVPVGAEVYIS